MSVGKYSCKSMNTGKKFLMSDNFNYKLGITLEEIYSKLTCHLGLRLKFRFPNSSQYLTQEVPLWHSL